ncbi:cell division protein FtsA [Brachyspira catarrhinii]|uniref:Cell division protein FtsA n=1 Tax=Brachyspira catarrhinii TaxID=2528966 RepID=A0ABY2TU63_9SPIR|nr:cell division protein FtsA [Brachyspira catarrhinii]TKZ36294.1 cell division protein FtsA [Brachyspira catarrhinii]
MKEPIIAGIDAGSSSIKTVIARVNDDKIEVIGIGESESEGIMKGIVVNIEAAADAIEKSVNQAEQMAGIQSPDPIATIGGEHIQGKNSKGVIGVNNKNKEVTHVEIERVLESAKNILIPQDREIIETIEQEYSLDEQDEIKNPIGMSGTRLETRVHIITGLKYVSDNLRRTLNKMKFTGRDFIVNVRGSAEAVLTRDEKELGVVVFDIGHSTTSLMVFLEGAVWHTAVIPIGSHHITNDISKGLRITIPAAEKLKCDHGYAFIDMIGEREIIEVPTASGKLRTIPKRALTEIIQPRVEEIFSLCGQELAKMKYIDSLSAGMVFTGGGALIPGLVDLAKAYQTAVKGAIPISARIGVPDKILGIRDIANNPAYSAVVGILMMSLDEATPMNIQSGKKSSDKKFKFKNPFNKNPFSEFFK